MTDAAEVPPPSTERPSLNAIIEFVALNTGTIVTACQMRLADDATLLSICRGFCAKYGPRSQWSATYLTFRDVPALVPESYEAVKREMDAIELRMAKKAATKARQHVKALESKAKGTA